jgi:nucleoside-diphosphate-sugar epimerase
MKIVVIGASGFIGKHLLDLLIRRVDLQIIALVHQVRPCEKIKVVYKEGDLLSIESLDLLIEENCIVVNLAYFNGDNIKAANNLAKICAEKRIKRLIHCSTAMVVGRTEASSVTEEIKCNPFSEYEKNKLKIEQVFLDISLGKFEMTILRPTAVFGDGGKNLVKLVQDLVSKKIFFNYMKSSLFGSRSMNLVSVENVVAAIEFLISAEKVDRQIYIISDDSSSMNNYLEIENKLLLKLNKKYPFPRLPIPKIILKSLLFVFRKSNLNPNIKFSDKKIIDTGFKKPLKFEHAIQEFLLKNFEKKTN